MSALRPDGGGGRIQAGAISRPRARTWRAAGIGTLVALAAIALSLALAILASSLIFDNGGGLV